MGWNFFSHERKMSRDSYKNNNLFFLAMNNYISLHYKLVKVDVGSVPGLLGSSEGWQWCLWDAFVRLSYGEDGITKTKWHLILFWYIFVIATWCVQMGRLHTTRHSSEIKWLCTCLKASNFFFSCLLFIPWWLLRSITEQLYNTTFCIKKFLTKKIVSHEAASVVLHMAASACVRAMTHSLLGYKDILIFRFSSVYL